MCSSFEILSAHLLDRGAFEANKGQIVGEVLERLRELARLEAAQREYFKRRPALARRGEPAADGAEFDAQPSPPDMMNRLSVDDWIAAWFQILEDEMARATAPDEIIEIPKCGRIDPQILGFVG